MGRKLCGLVACILVCAVGTLLAESVQFVKITPDDFESLRLQQRAQFEVINNSSETILLATQPETPAEEFGNKVSPLIPQVLLDSRIFPVLPSGGIPFRLFSDQGIPGQSSFQPKISSAGDILAYVSTRSEFGLPAIKIQNLRTGKLVVHPIDSTLENDEPIQVVTDGHRVFYSFHYYNPAINNSDMRTYWFDSTTREANEIEGFGYAFEGFSAWGDWVLKTKSTGDGWNNTLHLQNYITGDSLIINSSTSIGSPHFSHNTLLWTDNIWDAPTLHIWDFGADGLPDTDDDVQEVLSNEAANSSVDRNERYIVWETIDPGNSDNHDVNAYDCGEDGLYGTGDDLGEFQVTTHAGRQQNPRISNSIIVWEDYRNTTYDWSGPNDIYGYNLLTQTEFRVTPSTGANPLHDINNNLVITTRMDWNSPSTDSWSADYDIWAINISGRFTMDYYTLEFTDNGYANGQSIITGTGASNSMPALGGLVLGQTNAVIWSAPSAGSHISIYAYSAFTGTWEESLNAYGESIDVLLDQENALILWANQDTSSVYGQGYDGVSNSFTSSTSLIGIPTGFDIGRNLAMIWDDNDAGQDDYLYVYDKAADHWQYKTYFNASNNHREFIFGKVSDSLALALILGEIGPAQTVCELYNLRTGAWESDVLGVTANTPEEAPKADLSTNMAVVYDDNDAPYFDYLWVYAADTTGWQEFHLPYSPAMQHPVFGENFLLCGAESNQNWQGYIYDYRRHDLLEDYIYSSHVVDGIKVTPTLLIAWDTDLAKLWGYSHRSPNMQQYQMNRFSHIIRRVEADGKIGIVRYARTNYPGDNALVFNANIGEWSEPFTPQGEWQEMYAHGNTALIVTESYPNFRFYGYSALQNSWAETVSNNYTNIDMSPYLAMFTKQTFSNTLTPMIYNALDGYWSTVMANTYFHENSFQYRMSDRTILFYKDPPSASAELTMYSPITDLLLTTPASTGMELVALPTGVLAWNNSAFQTAANTDLEWTAISGPVNDVQYSDYAATVWTGNNTHYFSYPREEYIETLELTEEPGFATENTYTGTITWKTNINSTAKLTWGPTSAMEYTVFDTSAAKNHSVRVDALDAQTNYYYQVEIYAAGEDTIATEVLTFNPGTDGTIPALVGIPRAIRIHSDAATIVWETDEPSTMLLKWGSTNVYSDSISDPVPSLHHSWRIYDLTPDSTYYFQVGGVDRYGNGPFLSGDFTFVTRNELPPPGNLAAMDSTIYGCAYLTWEPPHTDSLLARESFDSGIPVDWQVVNQGSDLRGNTWYSGLIGNNGVAYVPYGSQNEYQEEWLITNAVRIDGAHSVLNFYQYAAYESYDNAPNAVMISTTNRAPASFTQIWQSQYLPSNWTLTQIPLDLSAYDGHTVYFAFVYRSTYGETWVIDDVYLDASLDGYTENFDSYVGNWPTVWTRWNLGSNTGGSSWYNYFWSEDGSSSLYCPDGAEGETSDEWAISPMLNITESHHMLGFWHSGYGTEWDNMPNEILAGDPAGGVSGFTLLRSFMPVPNGWVFTVVDLSQFIGNQVSIAWRYQSVWGESWMIDDIVLYENVPLRDGTTMTNAEYFVERRNFPDSHTMELAAFFQHQKVASTMSEEIQNSGKDILQVCSSKPLSAEILPDINTAQTYSALSSSALEITGFEIFSRSGEQQHFESRGVSTSPSFLDYTIYNGMTAEYYVETIYEQGQSQPSNTVIGAGGQKLAPNEYAWDTGIVGYSYYGWPGLGLANYFGFDSSLALQTVKVHIEEPGSFVLNVYDWLDNDNLQELWSGARAVTSRGWHTFPIDADLVTDRYLIEFVFGDSLVQISYDPIDNGVAYVHDAGGWDYLASTPMIRVTGEFVTTDFKDQAALPTAFAVQQNYPNPFNPVTTIPYQIPKQSHVTVAVYDIRGRKIATLVNADKTPGYYQVSWDGTTTSGKQAGSGVYFVRMEAKGFTAQKKVLLVK